VRGRQHCHEKYTLRDGLRPSIEQGELTLFGIETQQRLDNSLHSLELVRGIASI